MEPIKMFDNVQLTNGLKGAVVEIFGDQELFMVDVGSSPADWETIEVRREQILKVL